jgi:hypothetical protein
VKPSRLARRQAQFQLEVQTEAAKVFRVALADLVDAKPGVSLKEALERKIRGERWYRRLWRKVAR